MRCLSKRILAVATSAAFVCCMLAGCTGSGPTTTESPAPAQQENQSELITIDIPTRVVNIAMHANEYPIDDLRESGEGHFVDLTDEGSIGEDYHVLLTVTEQDRQWWIGYTEQLLTDARAEMERYAASIGEEGYEFSYDDTFTQLSYAYNQAADADAMVGFIYQTEYLCIMRQLLSGAGDTSWEVSIAIINSDTSNIVAQTESGSETIGNGITIDDEDWERSYQQ